MNFYTVILKNGIAMQINCWLKTYYFLIFPINNNFAIFMQLKQQQKNGVQFLEIIVLYQKINKNKRKKIM